MYEGTKKLSHQLNGPQGGEWSGLLETSGRFGSYSWIESRMFQILGAWAGGGTVEAGSSAGVPAGASSVAGDAVALMFDDHARRHAWHSRVWFERLPELSNVDAEGLVRTPSEQFARMMDEAAALDDPLEQLTVADVLVTHLVVTYRHELTRLDDIGDATSRHWLGFVLQNLTEELLQVDSMASDLVRSEADVDASAVVRSAFAKKLLVCGGPAAQV